MPVHLVIASERRTLDTWRRCVGVQAGVEFWLGRPRDAVADAVAVAGAFAYERYGGRPLAGEARVLRNGRGDGFPGLVVVPASRPMRLGTDGRPVVRAEFADVSPAYFGLSRALAALREWNDVGNEPHVDVLLLPLALLGMDDAEDTATPASVGRALREAAG